MASVEESISWYPHFELMHRLVATVPGLGRVLILLFGSVAKEEFTRHSDADLLAVFAEPMDWSRVCAWRGSRVQPVAKGME